MAHRRERIRLSDGREGYQVVAVDDEDGTETLDSVVITKAADGSRCNHTYARRSDLRARVYSLADLGNVTWELVE